MFVAVCFSRMSGHLLSFPGDALDKRTLNNRTYILLMSKENCRPLTGHLSKSTASILSPATSKADFQSCLSVNGRKECHDHYMRLLVGSNAEYFQAKLRATQQGRKNELRLKIPYRTGATVYKKDFKSKQQKYHHQPLRQNMSIDCIKTNNFLKDQPIDLRISDKTNYQKEYRYQPVRTEHCRIKKRVETSNDADDTAPRFMETQNKTDFLNWAGKNYVPSMKPAEKPAVTNLPFQGTTVYKSDFQAKNASPTPIIVRGASFPNFGSVSMLMRSNYNREFEAKNVSAESSCKPRHFDANLCKQFKGTTEYKREFITCKKDSEEDEHFKTVDQLATLIIDL